MKDGPWTSGPRELLDHAKDHLAKGTDVDNRFAMISVANAVVVGYLDPTGQGPFWIPLIFGSITLWMAGILGYWWVKLLFGGYGEPERWVEEDEDDTSAVKALTSWSKLSEAMTTLVAPPQRRVQLLSQQCVWMGAPARGLYRPPRNA